MSLPFKVFRSPQLFAEDHPRLSKKSFGSPVVRSASVVNG